MRQQQGRFKRPSWRPGNPGWRGERQIGHWPPASPSLQLSEAAQLAARAQLLFAACSSPRRFIMATAAAVQLYGKWSFDDVEVRGSAGKAAAA